jgi:hypothetical protein
MRGLTTSFLPRDHWPTNYVPDSEDERIGTYFCPKCGDGKTEAELTAIRSGMVTIQASIAKLQSDVAYRDEVIDQRNAELSRRFEEMAAKEAEIASLHALLKRTNANVCAINLNCDAEVTLSDISIEIVRALVPTPTTDYLRAYIEEKVLGRERRMRMDFMTPEGTVVSMRVGQPLIHWKGGRYVLTGFPIREADMRQGFSYVSNRDGREFWRPFEELFDGRFHAWDGTSEDAKRIDALPKTNPSERPPRSGYTGTHANLASRIRVPQEDIPGSIGD